MRRNSNFGVFAFGGIFALLIIGVIAATPIIHFTTKETVENVKVVKTERVRNGDSDRYLVFTPDEVFENTDTIWGLKFNSSDLYRDINDNSTCDFVVNGFRIPLFSMYRNILEQDCN